MIGERCDVAVVGGGPAGAAAALTLARGGASVRLIEASHYREPRIGETLPPWATPLLERLGLWEASAPARVTPSFANQSVWGEPKLATNAFVFNPYGTGWHIARERFDELLAGTAADAGAQVHSGVRVRSATATACAQWQLTLTPADEQRATTRLLQARALVLATGRDAQLARSLGARRRVLDHLVGVAAWIHTPASTGGYLLVEAQPEGWWYSAPIDDERMVAAFMTDADLCPSAQLRSPEQWRRRLMGARHTHERIGASKPLTHPTTYAAISQRLERPAARAPWLAAGDSALAVDPLSSGGIARAIASGEGAAVAMLAWLGGDSSAEAAYEHWLDAQFAEYLGERAATYAQETRWHDAPFWERRRLADLKARGEPAGKPS